MGNQFDQWDGDDERESAEFDNALDLAANAGWFALGAVLALVFSVFVRWL